MEKIKKYRKCPALPPSKRILQLLFWEKAIFRSINVILKMIANIIHTDESFDDKCGPNAVEHTCQFLLPTAQRAVCVTE